MKAIPWLSLLILLGYTYAWFFVVPYAGFRFGGSKSTILTIYKNVVGSPKLQVGDDLIAIKEIKLEQFRNDPYSSLYDGVESGDIIPLVVERNSTLIEIDWEFPGFTQTELIQRLYSLWWLGYVFWFIGTLSFLLIRPRNTLWRLLIAFNYLTAIWLTAGNGPSALHVAGSLMVVRSAMWLSIPVFLHLHWIFPAPLRKIKIYVWKGLYFLTAITLIAEILVLLPKGIYQQFYALTLLVSLILLASHAFVDKTNRQTLRLLLLGAVFAIGPILILSIIPVDSDTTRYSALILLIAFPLLPASYFYAAARRQFGGLELRANRVISIYLFIIVLGTAVLAIVPTTISLLDESNSLVIASLISAIATAIIVLTTFNRFERFVEIHILQVPIPSTQLAQVFSEKITTSLSSNALAQLIKKNILPSLLIRQSALLLIENFEINKVLVKVGITDSMLPASEEILTLLDLAGNLQTSPNATWIRLVLPMYVNKTLNGIWLFGNRDPDDYYSQAEIEMLKSLANQTAIAVTNINQANRLKSMYKANIDRHEGERKRLAHDLHDVVLNQLASIYSFVEDDKVALEIKAQHQVITNRLRRIIQDLRPTMLDYGFSKAIEELVETISKRSDYKISLDLKVSPGQSEISTNVELHMYRIIQQSCENALRHANASEIHISGKINPKKINISVVDNGQGFKINPKLDLVSLLDSKQFGIVGMIERAALIDAQINIVSKIGTGTTITVSYSKP